MLERWKAMSGSSPPPDEVYGKQKFWDRKITEQSFSILLANCTSQIDKARILASKAAHTGDWLNAPPIISIGLRMSNETIRVAVGLRLGAQLCEPHQCSCGALVDARGLHGLSCRRNAGRHGRHSLLNDTIRRALNKGRIQSTKEPTGLLRSHGKRPDGVMLIPWAKGRCRTWDVNSFGYIRDFAHYVNFLSTRSCSRTRCDAQETKYTALSQTPEFVLLAIETSGVFNSEGLEFVKKIGSRISNSSSGEKEAAYLFQRIPVAIQKGNSISFSGSFEQCDNKWEPAPMRCF